MANDITKSILSNPIKNNTIIVNSCAKTASVQVLNTYVTNKPIISDIESMYDTRFDDPSYYYGIGNSSVIGT